MCSSGSSCDSGYRAFGSYFFEDASCPNKAALVKRRVSKTNMPIHNKSQLSHEPKRITSAGAIDRTASTKSDQFKEDKR